MLAGMPSLALTLFTASTAVAQRCPGARLKESVTTGNWPWWLTVMGAVSLHPSERGQRHLAAGWESAEDGPGRRRNGDVCDATSCRPRAPTTTSAAADASMVRMCRRPPARHQAYVRDGRRGGRHAGADEQIAQVNRIIPKLGLHFENHVVLVQLREDGRDLPLAVRVVEGLVDGRRRDAEP